MKQRVYRLKPPKTAISVEAEEESEHDEMDCIFLFFYVKNDAQIVSDIVLVKSVIVRF
jgi:hypothetical protein